MAAGDDITRQDVMPIIPSAKYQLINIYRDGLTYLSPVSNEGTTGVCQAKIGSRHANI